VWTPVCMEPTLKYHPLMFDVLTLTRNPGCGQCLVGSLTGAVLLLSIYMLSGSFEIQNLARPSTGFPSSYNP